MQAHVFLFTALFRSVSTDVNACKFVAGIVWCGRFIVTEKSLNKPYLAFKHTSLLDYKTWLSRHVLDGPLVHLFGEFGLFLNFMPLPRAF